MTSSGFTVTAADWHRDYDDLRRIRERVFVIEQNVPIDAELDELDAVSSHVLARDDTGRPIGTGRLTPDATIGRVAVLSGWRGLGVGDALMQALLATARDKRLPRVSLHSQIHALPFYEKLGFIAEGHVYLECGIEHRTMSLALTPTADAAPSSSAAADPVLRVHDRNQLVDAHRRLLADARHEIAILTDDLDPGVLDTDIVVAELRRIALSGRRANLRILVRRPSSQASTLIALAQRLPSRIAVRTPVDEADQALATGLVINDRGGYLLRNDAGRNEGHGHLDDRARHRPLLARFNEMWERAEPVAELRALSI